MTVQGDALRGEGGFNVLIQSREFEIHSAPGYARRLAVPWLRAGLCTLASGRLKKII